MPSCVRAGIRKCARIRALSGQIGEWLSLPNQFGLVAPSALSAMALSYESPTVPVDGSIPYSITLAV